MEDTVVYQETESVVQLYSERQQKQWGDSLNEESEVELPAKLYGHISFLLHITVNPQMVKALVDFWNPPYTCFTIDGIDMVPTIEEYTSLLHLMTQRSPYRTYVPNSRISLARELYNLAGVKIQRTVGESKRITWKCLKELLEEEKGEEVQIHLFALAIYGLIVFPKELGTIDRSTISFVGQVKNGANPIPGILAETFRSLNKCRSKGQERLKCCVSLLYVWFASHLPSNQGGYRNTFLALRISLAEFEEAQQNVQWSKANWNEKLHKLRELGLVWQAPWMNHSNMMYRCGNFPWVPLLGPWGGIAYAPLMARRQVGASQFVPMTHGLADSDFAYEIGDTQNQIRKFMVAWKHVHLIGPGDEIATIQGNYEVWRENRVNPQLKRIPEVVIEHVKSPSACMQLKLQGDPCPAEKGDARAEVENQQKEALISVYRKEIKQQRIRYIQSEEEVVALRKERRRLRAALERKSQMLEDAHTESKKKSLYIQELERQWNEQRSNYNQVLEKMEPCITKAGYWEAKFRALHKKTTQQNAEIVQS
ncbi:uncharacterized protein LOC131147782 [Malania oleifera]|uniref:uncharacterized protein LOC131147782 n=1 Tax=Malania oleifera TaxID=397392 RepID=UPI0025AEAB10|nr:uncharacterized protein LOC131147782 [Malania oleifera]